MKLKVRHSDAELRKIRSGHFGMGSMLSGSVLMSLIISKK